MVWQDASRVSPYSGQRRLPSWLGQPFHAYAHFDSETPESGFDQVCTVSQWAARPLLGFLCGICNKSHSLPESVGHDSNLQRTERGIYGEELRNPWVSVSLGRDLNCDKSGSRGGPLDCLVWLEEQGSC